MRNKSMHADEAPPFWEREPFAADEIARDAQGFVLGALITERTARGRLKLIIGCWAACSDGFVAPDGRPTLQLEEVEALCSMTDEEIEKLVRSKIQ